MDLYSKQEKRLLYLFKIGLVDRSKLSQYRLAFKDVENNVKFQAYRSKILDILSKMTKLITDNDAIYEKVKQEILRKYGTARMKRNKIAESLKKKSIAYDIDIDTIIEVYNRGIELTEEYGVPNNKTPEQVAFERVNSFLNDGEAAKTDNDLMEMAAKRGPGRPRTRPIKKYNVKSASNRSLAKVAAGSGPHARDAARELAARKKSSASVPKRKAAKQMVASTAAAKPAEIQNMIKAAPRGAIKAELRKVLRSKEAQAERESETLKGVKSDYAKVASAMTNPKNRAGVQAWIAKKAAEEKKKPETEKPASKEFDKDSITNHPDFEKIRDNIYKKLTYDSGNDPIHNYQAKIKAHVQARNIILQGQKEIKSKTAVSLNKVGEGPKLQTPERKTTTITIGGKKHSIDTKKKKGVLSRIASRIKSLI